jgi:hypothetical protein
MVKKIAPVFMESILFCVRLQVPLYQRGIQGDLSSSESSSFFWRTSQTTECSLEYVERRFDMNHPSDLNPESTNRGTDPEIHAFTLPTDSERSRSANTLSSTPRSLRLEESSSKGPSESSKHLKLLETLIDKILKRLEDDSCQPKIRDALLAIQLRQKAVETSEAEKIFWDEIEAIRNEELPKLYPDPNSLEYQIKETILGLKDLVKNGILPLKTITKAFNQDRSEQARLTHRRMGRLLSDMGFTKAKTPNGCSAIIWNDKLLFMYT